jgi:hypothetical protein
MKSDIYGSFARSKKDFGCSMRILSRRFIGIKIGKQKYVQIH